MGKHCQHRNILSVRHINVCSVVRHSCDCKLAPLSVIDRAHSLITKSQVASTGERVVQSFEAVCN